MTSTVIGFMQHAHGGSLVDIVWHSFVDIAPMVPILFVLYFALEYFWHHRGLDILALTRITGFWGPLIGTVLGIVPQCGMSVFITSLYLSRRITLGTLIATYLATSDEALPVLLAHGGMLSPILTIIGTKLVIGALAGLAIDAIIRQPMYKGATRPVQSHIVATIEHEMHTAPWKEIFYHSAKRTLEIFGWVFGVSLALGYAMSALHAGDAVHALSVHPLLEVAAAGVFGLIPNCGASIAIAEAYIHTGLSFGATIAGLSAGAGYGPIVLFKDGNRRHSLFIMILCAAIAILAGWIIVLA